MSSRSSEMSKFYTDVFVSNSRNQLSTRCRFLVSWTFHDLSYRPTTPASRYAGQSYDKVRGLILELLMRFRRYVERIDVPDLEIGGKPFDDGLGTVYVQDNSMLHPGRNTLDVSFLETQVSVSDMMNVWLEVNARPFVRPIRLNLNLDYLSDLDGSIPVMSYQVVGCRPQSMQLINCTHDGRDVKARRVTFGFDAIRPVTSDASRSSEKDSAVLANWNAMMAGYLKVQQQAEEERRAAEEHQRQVTIGAAELLRSTSPLPLPELR